MPNGWVELERQVLRENTAQAIHQQLEEQESLPERYSKRWIWELFQNALDAAPKQNKVKVHIESHDEFRFSHNGAPFSRKEILHLILHGSTKREDGDSIGRYGTGFLTTHVVSRRVRIKGCLDTDEDFDFTLDREGRTPHDLELGMERSIQELLSSAHKRQEGQERWTQFEYFPSTSQPAVEQAIRSLGVIAPYVLAFNPGIECISIKAETETHFSVLSEVRLSQNCHLVGIGQQSKRPDIHVAIAARDGVCVALPLTELNGKFVLRSLDLVSKLFVAFPLLGTENIPLPYVFNCSYCMPTPERDGLYLGSKDEDNNRKNKRLLEDSWPLFQELIQTATAHGWGDLYRLATIRSAPDLAWLDRSWMDDFLRGQVESTFLNAPLVETEMGTILEPRNAIFPEVSPPDQLQALRDLVLAVYGDQSPRQETVAAWSSILEDWHGLLSGSSLSIIPVTLDRLAQRVAEVGSFESLTLILANNAGTPANGLEWLNHFFSLLEKCDALRRLTDVTAIIPTQNGDFRLRKKLRRDPGIEDELKEIGKGLGIDIRSELAEPSVLPAVQELLVDLKQEDFLNALLQEVSTQSKAEYFTGPYRRANALLFGWLVRQQKVQDLRTYPMFSCKIDSKGNEEIAPASETRFAPIGAWHEKVQTFAPVFPFERIASSLYCDHVARESWAWLVEIGLLVCDPLVTLRKEFDRDALEVLLDRPLPDGDESEHHIEISSAASIVLLSELRESTRKSREKTQLFLRFLVGYVLPQTCDSLNFSELKCSCGRGHLMHRAYWLGNLKQTKWVYDRKGGSHATAANLAQLWKNDPFLMDRLSDPVVLTFLQRLGVSPSELMRHAVSDQESRLLDYESALVTLLTASKYDPGKIRQAAEILSDPSMVLEFERRKVQRERTARNQALGSLVESLFAELFQQEGFRQRGLCIERTGWGSDFAIEYDFVQGNDEIGFVLRSPSRKFFIELKSTLDSSVAMTLAQARMAVDQRDCFALCVVGLVDRNVDSEQVRKAARFVTNIGHLLRDKVNLVNQVAKMQEQAATGGGDIEVVLEKGLVRFRMKNPVWETDMCFESFAEFLAKSLTPI